MKNGVYSMYSSIKSGVVGSVYLPQQGFRKDGIKGLLKGTGKGAIGLVLKPVSGLIDVVAITSEGMSNDLSSYKAKKRQRIKRVLYGRYSLIKMNKNVGYNFCNNDNDKLVRQVESINSEVTAYNNFMDAIEIEIVDKSIVHRVYILFFEKIIIYQDKDSKKIEKIIKVNYSLDISA